MVRKETANNTIICFPVNYIAVEASENGSILHAKNSFHLI